MLTKVSGEKIGSPVVIFSCIVETSKRTQKFKFCKSFLFDCVDISAHENLYYR